MYWLMLANWFNLLEYESLEDNQRKKVFLLR